MKLNRIIDNTDIPTQKVFLKWYARLPFIIACLTIFFSLFFSIYIPVTYKFTLAKGFAFFLGFMLCGLIAAVLEYLIVKMFQAHHILTVAFLEKLNNSSILENYETKECKKPPINNKLQQEIITCEIENSTTISDQQQLTQNNKSEIEDLSETKSNKKNYFVIFALISLIVVVFILIIFTFIFILNFLSF